MLTDKTLKCHNVYGFSDEDIQRIKDYLQGAVQSWCRDRKGKWFSARDLLGGNNFYWNGTPLIVLYENYAKKGDNAYAIRQAGIAAGHLLKQVLRDDTKRQYDSRKSYTRQYCWVGKEML